MSACIIFLRMDDHKMEGGSGCGGGGGGGGCKCAHHRMPGLFVLLIAVAFLLGNLGYVSMSTVGIAWPILLGLCGLMKITKGMCKCC